MIPLFVQMKLHTEKLFNGAWPVSGKHHAMYLMLKPAHCCFIAKEQNTALFAGRSVFPQAFSMWYYRIVYKLPSFGAHFSPYVLILNFSHVMLSFNYSFNFYSFHSSHLQSAQDRYFGVVPWERPCPFQALWQCQGDAFPLQEVRRRTQPLSEWLRRWAIHLLSVLLLSLKPSLCLECHNPRSAAENVHFCQSAYYHGGLSAKRLTPHWLISNRLVVSSQTLAALGSCQGGNVYMNMCK